jgi:hypothetical protein
MKHDHFTMLPELAFRRLGWKLLSLEGGGKGSSPPPPNYAAAATATAAGNLDAARAAAAANRVDQVTPYGSLTYSHNPAVASPDGGWTATQTLSPVEQQKLNLTNALETGLLGTAQEGLGYVDNTLGSGGALNESKLAQPSIQGKAVQDAIFSRLNPQLDRDRASLDTRLQNQGVFMGSEAYNNAHTDQSQRENDLYTQAALQGISTGQQARQQGIQEQYVAQDRPLNIINALRTGSQVQAPQFTAVPQQATTAGADMLGAAQGQSDFAMNQYSADQAQQSSTNGMLGSAAMATAYFL